MILQATQLTKRFGAYTAVDALDLHIEPGECVGLLGPAQRWPGGHRRTE